VSGFERFLECRAGSRHHFDDGYRSAYTIAFPILQKYRLPATIYLTAESVETGQVAWYDRVFLAISVAPAGEFQLDLESPWYFT